VTPCIDGIDKDTFAYLGGPETTTRGVFSWSLLFTWLEYVADDPSLSHH
jgi:polypeptide N-acetylgalactosaminyltransferase